MPRKLGSQKKDRLLADVGSGIDQPESGRMSPFDEQALKRIKSKGRAKLAKARKPKRPS